MTAVTPDQYQKYLEVAKEEARKGLAEGGMPIGACVVHLPTGKILGQGRNQMPQKNSLILHAEMDALENVIKNNGGPLDPDVLPNCAMFTTLSACPMCSGAVIQYGLKLVVMAENTNSVGGERILEQYGVELFNLHDVDSVMLLKNWIGSEEGKRLWGKKR